MTTTRSRPLRTQPSTPADPGAARRATAPEPDQGRARAGEPGPDAIGTRRGVVIERIEPELDGGRHAVKRVVGDDRYRSSLQAAGRRRAEDFSWLRTADRMWELYRGLEEPR